MYLHIILYVHVLFAAFQFFLSIHLMLYPKLQEQRFLWKSYTKTCSQSVHIETVHVIIINILSMNCNLKFLQYYKYQLHNRHVYYHTKHHNNTKASHLSLYSTRSWLSNNCSDDSFLNRCSSKQCHLYIQNTHECDRNTEVTCIYHQCFR